MILAASNVGPAIGIFFLGLIFVGNWILWNFFLATMVVSFRKETLRTEAQEARRKVLNATGGVVLSEKKQLNEWEILTDQEKFRKRIERVSVGEEGCRRGG